MPQHVTSLVRTSVKTANYTASSGDLVPVDTTSGNVTITLPTAPPTGNRVAVKHVTQGGTNKVTVACGGSDVFNKTGGVTSALLSVLNQAITVQYDGGIWTVVSDDIPLTALNAAYPGRWGGNSPTAATLPFVNVRDYGAVGDATTDDTAAIQAAITAATATVNYGREVRFPAGSYKIAGNLTYADRGLRLVGASRGRGTNLIFTGSGAMLSNGSDTAVTRTDGAITSGSAALTGSGFTGKTGTYVSVTGAGVGGAVLTGTILSVTNDTNCTLSVSASASVGPTASYTLSPWNANLYDGVQSLSVEHMLIMTSGGAAALSNGTGNYLAGSTGIQDWRGGDIALRRVTLQGFETGFFGIQSDVNRWDGVELIGNKTGAYLGPRSDQFTCTALYAFGNDRALDLDRVTGHRFFGCQFVGNGSNTALPIRVRSAWDTGAASISFDDCWFEHFQGYAVAAVEAFVEVGVTDLVTSTDIHFRNPQVATNATGTLPRIQYLVKCDRGDNISIENPAANWRNLDKMIEFTGTTSPSALLRARNTLGASAFSTVNNGSGSPSVTQEQWGAGGSAGAVTIGGGGFTAGALVGSGRTTTGVISQTLAANGAVPINVQNGNIQVVNLQANATSSTLTNVPASGTSPTALTLEWVQDATGSRTYAWPTNCVFAGGAAPTASTTANFRDSVTFRYDTGASKWYEVARSIGVR